MKLVVLSSPFLEQRLDISLATAAFAILINISPAQGKEEGSCPLPETLSTRWVAHGQDGVIAGCNADNCAMATAVKEIAASKDGAPDALFKMKVPVNAREGTLWIKYRNRAGKPIRVSNDQIGPGTLPLEPAQELGWQPLLDKTRDPVRLSRPANGTLDVRVALGAMDTVDCMAFVANTRVLPGVAHVLDVGESWSGTPLAYGAVVHKGLAFIGYYDPDRWLTVAAVELSTGRVKRVRLNSQFGGWDSHNSVAVVVDGRGTLHVAGNMHASPLAYFSGPAVFELSGLQQRAMTGRNEARTTYPRFIQQPDGRLKFMYREGGSGDGKWLLNTQTDDGWRRATEAPVFSDEHDGRSVSAYPSEIVFGRDGQAHVAVVWRETPDVSTNFKVTYARTQDFVNWYGANGRKLVTPLTPQSMDPVIEPGTNAGLLNTPRLALSASGIPVIAYTHYVPDGGNGLYVAWPAERSWRETLVDASAKRLILEKGGSLSVSVAIQPFGLTRDGRISLSYRLPGSQTKAVTVAPEEKSPVSQPHLAGQALPRSLERLFAVPNKIPQSRMVFDSANRQDRSGMWILWSSLRSERDKRPKCLDTTPQTCESMPTMLRLIVLSQNSNTTTSINRTSPRK